MLDLVFFQGFCLKINKPVHESFVLLHLQAASALGRLSICVISPDFTAFTHKRGIQMKEQTKKWILYRYLIAAIAAHAC